MDFVKDRRFYDSFRRLCKERRKDFDATYMDIVMYSNGMCEYQDVKNFENGIADSSRYIFVYYLFFLTRYNYDIIQEWRRMVCRK